MKKHYLLIFVCIIVGFCVCACSSEKDAWDEQMQQDPSTWDNEQADRYNDFMDWLDDN